VSAFTRRVAGNVVNDFVMGSIVNAVNQNGARLVMVMGHTRCGMVARAVHTWAKHEAQKMQKGKPASTEVSMRAHCLQIPQKSDGRHLFLLVLRPCLPKWNSWECTGFQMHMSRLCMATCVIKQWQSEVHVR
jgi:hypothetical protein